MAASTDGSGENGFSLDASLMAASRSCSAIATSADRPGLYTGREARAERGLGGDVVMFAVLLVPILPWMGGFRGRLARFVAPTVAILMALPLVVAPSTAVAQTAPGCTAPPSVPATAGGPIGGFNPISPVRLLDTRPSGKVGAGCVVSVDVSSVAPAGAAGI